MASDRADVPISTRQDELSQELLHLVLNDEMPYPWSPETPDSELLFSRLEDEWVAGQLADELEAIATQSQSFFATLSQAWSSVDAVTARTLQTNLVEHFGSRVPQTLLAKISQQAQNLVSAQAPLAEQLVQCVQDLFSGWSHEDLLVLARPYASAMRGSDTETLEAALRSVRYAAWTELSGVEQARLSLAIARYTLSQLPSKPTNL